MLACSSSVMDKPLIDNGQNSKSLLFPFPWSFRHQNLNLRVVFHIQVSVHLTSQQSNLFAFAPDVQALQKQMLSLLAISFSVKLKEEEKNITGICKVRPKIPMIFISVQMFCSHWTKSLIHSDHQQIGMFLWGAMWLYMFHHKH